MNTNIDTLIANEGWKVERDAGKDVIVVNGVKFPKVHPVAIHLKLYREATNPESKYLHMKAAHDYLWPNNVWHAWTEWRFKEHCAGWKYISYAGGAGSSKSYDAAKIGILWWLSDPKNHAVIVASTTLTSLETRIWGYVLKHLNELDVKVPFRYRKGNAPCILNPRQRGEGTTEDTIHGMFALAAKRGSDEQAISNWIGKHPNKGLMMVLDEGTDMPTALFKALPNLEQGVEFFQCMVIGNSNEEFDLHGLLSTPKDGWDSVDPHKDRKWETTRERGVCLFFNCYDSPAINDPDPEKREVLGKFLITQESIDKKKVEYGGDTIDFYRFVLGFWKRGGTANVVISKEFLKDFKIMEFAEWSGRMPLQIVAGLDPAFSTGGDSCILRLAILGYDVDGNHVLDFRGNELLFKIPILANGKSAELQISEFTTAILAQYNCPLHHLVIDATGQGRALAEVIRLNAGAPRPPIKIYTVRTGNVQRNSFDVVVRTALDMWFAFRPYIQSGQIKGLDEVAALQLTTRRYKMNEKTLKVVLEGKAEYRTRMAGVMPSLAHSPDEADAASLVLQSAIINFGFSVGEKRELRGIRTLQEEKAWVLEEENKLRGVRGPIREHPTAKFTSSPESLKPFRFSGS